MKSIAKILKGHEGETLYSPILGEVILKEVEDCNIYPIMVEAETTLGLVEYNFTSDGRFLESAPYGECMLFPAKDQRDWDKYNQKEYKVTFASTSTLYTAEELKNFINAAVISNKDVSKFSVERIKQ